MRSFRLVPLCLLLACGDDSKKPDAGVRPDTRMIDAAIDAPTVIECAHTEANDAGNDDLFGTGNAETTSISFGTTAIAICGKFNMGHYTSGNMNVDVDSYMFTVPTATRGILHLTAAGAENFDTVLIEIYGMTSATSETGQFAGNFAVTAADLPPGDYEITVSAYDSADPTAALDYKLTLELDSATRCPKSTATAVPEAGEGNPATGGGNDVYEVRYGSAPARKLTDLPTDMPEATGITVAAGQSYHVTGVNSTFTATPTSWADSFQDRDTYAVTMGPTTNQLAVRLNWPGTTADFDFFVFPMGGLVERANGWYPGNMEDEFTTLAVTPGATYWIFVGADDASTGQPVNYDLTLCGEAYAP